MSATNGKGAPQTKGRTMLRNMSMTINEATTQLIASRMQAAGYGQGKSPGRDLYKECGYPKALGFGDYRMMHEREGVASRVVSIYPDECFAVDPLIYETERSANTPFEEAWAEMCESDTNNPFHYLHRADILSGVGSYGAILLGINDGRDLSEPLDGIEETGEQSRSRPQGARINFLRALDEVSVQVKNFQVDQNNPRYGRPQAYNVLLADLQPQSGSANPAVIVSGSPSSVNGTAAYTLHEVHWSRVVHLADNREQSETFGVSRLRNVYNKILDLAKILGSSAEMFFKGGFPGISLEVDPRILEMLNIEFDQDAVDQEMFEYMNGLRRYLSLVGLNAKSLATQVADPRGNVTAILESIAMSIGAPLRIFMGSEQAQLASGQDVRTWNRRLKRRQERYLGPLVLRPFVNRLINIGVLPVPQKGRFKIFWPDVNMPDEDERSQIADRRAASLLKFVTSGGWQMMQPSDFYRFVWGLEPDEVAVIMRRLKKKPEVKFEPLPGQAVGDTGVGGSPPSKSSDV